MRETVLITGASGFLGNHLVKRISAEPCSLILITRKSFPAGEEDTMHGNITRLNLDLLKQYDREFTARIKKKLASVTKVIHMAALMPQGGPQDFHGYFMQNLQLSYNLLEYLPENLRHFCFVSSVDIYGKPIGQTMDENHPISPTTYYGASKIAIENIFKVFFKNKTTKLCFLRFSQIYGPGERPGKIIPKTINNALGNKPIEIYGEGKDKRDYIYVEDAADILTQAMNTGCEGVFNISSGRSYPVFDVVEIIRKITASSSRLVFKRQGKNAYDLQFNLERAEKAGLLPVMTPLETGLKRQIQWVIDNRDGQPGNTK